MSEEEEKAIEILRTWDYYYVDEKEDFEAVDNAIQTILNLIEKQQEIQQLKYLITKATKIIDEYANETEKDTKKLIEYQEKFIQELLEENKSNENNI